MSAKAHTQIGPTGESAPRILFCGAAHIDRLGRTHGPAQPGRSNPGHFVEWPGGNAFNSARVFAALGGKGGLASILGEDAPGNTVRDAAISDGISTRFQTGDRTATYTAILDPSGDLAMGLADMEIYENFDAGACREEISELGVNDWLFLDANLPAKALEALATDAPCSVAATTTSAAKAGKLKSVLPHLDILFTNKAEVQTLFGGNKDAINNPSVPAIIITDGANPVLVKTGAATSHVETPQLTGLRDVTGAGDALAGACLFALTVGQDISQAVSLGIQAAQAIIGVDGPWRADLRSQLDIKTDTPS